MKFDNEIGFSSGKFTCEHNEGKCRYLSVPLVTVVGDPRATCELFNTRLEDPIVDFNGVALHRRCEKCMLETGCI